MLSTQKFRTMKKFYYTSIVICILSVNINAQSPAYTWAKQFGGSGGESGRSVAVDTSGNVYSTGIFGGTADFDPSGTTFNLVSTGGQDVYVSKLDSMGNFVWAKKIGGVVADNSASIKVDDAGNAYVAGTFNGTCSFGIINLTSAGLGDAFICKLDAAGNFLWAKRMGGTGNDAGLAVCIDGTGNVYSTGYFSSTGDFDPDPSFTFNLVSAGSLDIFISKLDGAGTFVSAYRLGGTTLDQGFDITLDPTGNILTTGNFSGNADFDPGGGSVLLSAGSGEDIYVNKLNPAGSFLWAKNMTGTAITNSGFSLSTDPSGNVYSTGYFSGTVDFDPGAGISSLISGGSTDAYVSKLDTGGNFVWVKQIGGTGFDGSYSLSLDANNSVYTGGDFQNTVDFDPGAGNFNMTSNTYDAYVSKLDASGNFTWAIQLATNNGDPAITADGSGNFYVTGAFSATTDFDAGAGLANLTSVGGIDVYVTKYSDCLSTAQPGPISGPASICAGSMNTYSVTIDPGATSYTWTLPGGWTGSSTTNSINTTSSATSGNITVTANNSCGSSAPQILAITVSASAPSTPSSMVGNPTVCIGIPQNYSVTNDPTASSYTWSLPAGWTGSSTTNSINATPGSSGIISVIANNGCGSSAAQTLNVTVSNPVLNVTPTPASCSDTCDGSIFAWTTGGIPVYTYTPFPLTDLCAGNYTVTVTDMAGCIATISTTITAPAPVIVNATTTDSILCQGDLSMVTLSGADTYTWNGSPSTTNFSYGPTISMYGVATGTNTTTGCMAADSIYFTVNPLPTVDFTYPGIDTVCINDGLQSLSGGTPAGGTYSGTGVSGTNFDPNVAGVGTHTIMYSYTDVNGCSGTDNILMTVNGCAGIDDPWEGSISVYPNPFTNHISVQGIQQKTKIRLYNAIGQLIEESFIDQNLHTIFREDLSSGIYFLNIETTNGWIVKKLMKE